MAKQIINIGAAANDKSGDPLRTAFNKVNQNFTELYGRLPATDRLVNGNNTVSLGENGTLTLPYPSSPTMTLTFDAAHYVATGPKPTLTLTGAPWELMGEYVYAPNGESNLALNSIFPTLNNPGYASGDQFTFDSSVHGRIGYTLTITLNNVVLPGGAGWTANVMASPPPEYTPTFESSGAIKLTSDISSWIFGTDGKLTLPLNGDIVNSNNISVLTPTVIDGGDASTTF